MSAPSSRPWALRAARTPSSVSPADATGNLHAYILNVCMYAEGSQYMRQCCEFHAGSCCLPVQMQIACIALCQDSESRAEGILDLPLRPVVCSGSCLTASALRSKLWRLSSLPADVALTCRWLFPQGYLRGRAETSQHRARAADQPQLDPAGRAHQWPGLHHSHAPAAPAQAAGSGWASSGTSLASVIVPVHVLVWRIVVLVHARYSCAVLRWRVSGLMPVDAVHQL